jgi:hypothetical protein
MKKNNRAQRGDIKDPEKDQVKMQAETIVIDMPEVKDIPGQENIIPPRLLEMEDMTISLADEEGEGLLDDLNKEDDQAAASANGGNVTPAERKLLKKSAGHQPTAETTDFERLTLDEKDAEGDFLNEKSIRQDRSGSDLDVPGTELDDEEELSGEEDEENNIYSQRD